MGKTLDSIKLDCEKEMAELRSLQQERMKQEYINGVLKTIMKNISIL
jgi:hypothetical protein